jgi:hypothetical protein
MKQQAHKYWNDTEKQFLKDNFQEYTCKELADKMERTVGSVKKMARELKIVKSEESLKKIYAKPNAGQFTSGDPANTLYDGAITMRIDPNGILYKWIRLKKGKWQQLHIYNWLKEGKSIPEGYIFWFKDGNHLNTEVSNLELITRAEHLQKNRSKNGTSQQARKRENKKLRQSIEKQQERETAANCAKLEKQERKEKRRIEKQQQQQLLQRKKDEQSRQQRFINNQLAERKRAPEKKDKPFATRQVDYTQFISVRIDHRTTIYVKPGQDIEQVKRNYLSRKASESFKIQK